MFCIFKKKNQLIGGTRKVHNHPSRFTNLCNQHIFHRGNYKTLVSIKQPVGQGRPTGNVALRIHTAQLQCTGYQIEMLSSTIMKILTKPITYISWTKVILSKDTQPSFAGQTLYNLPSKIGIRFSFKCIEHCFLSFWNTSSKCCPVNRWCSNSTGSHFHVASQTSPSTQFRISWGWRTDGGPDGAPAAQQTANFHKW